MIAAFYRRHLAKILSGFELSDRDDVIAMTFNDLGFTFMNIPDKGTCFPFRKDQLSFAVRIDDTSPGLGERPPTRFRS